MSEETQQLAGPYWFYNGTVKLWFDGRDRKHIYVREMEDGSLVPQLGVTTILKIIDKSFFLAPWAAKMAVAKAFRTMPTVESEGKIYTKSMPLDEFEALLLQAKSAHKDILDDAGSVGDMAHACIEESIRYARAHDDNIVEEMVNVPSEERALNCTLAAHSWMTEHNVRWLETEKKVYSVQYQCAGTMDGLCMVDSCFDPSCCPHVFVNHLAIADWKSSNQLRTEYAYQTAAYLKFYVEEHGGEIADRFIMRLGKDDGKFEQWHFGPDVLELHFKGFLDCLSLTKTHKETEAQISASKKAAKATRKALKPAKTKVKRSKKSADATN